MASEIPLVEGRESFEGFYGREYRRVLGLATVLTGSIPLAEELTQEAFIAAYRQWRRIDRPDVWIRAVVANHARSWMRRRYAEARALSRLGRDPKAMTLEMPADTEHFWEEVRALPRRQAQTIALVYLEDLSIRDVAGILGCSEPTARVHLARGRHRLATIFGAQEES